MLVLGAQLVEHLSRRARDRHRLGKVPWTATRAKDPTRRYERRRPGGGRRGAEYRYETSSIRYADGLTASNATQRGRRVLLELANANGPHMLQM